jgi:hypothetical protein
MTDSRGRMFYITMGEAILERMGQPRPSPQHRVCHKNGDKRDNRRENLEWRLVTIGPGASDN